MRHLISCAALAGLLIGPAYADTKENCDAGWKSMPSANQAKTTQEDYSAICLTADYKVVAPPTMPMEKRRICHEAIMGMKGHAPPGGLGAWMPKCMTSM